MNKCKSDILRTLAEKSFVNQRLLSEEAGHSLGSINRELKNLAIEGYIGTDGSLTDQAWKLLRSRAPRNAVILAAGFGMRMVPINMIAPKGLLEVHQEPLIERIIRQLHETGIRNITIVVGFMKERFEYLIDEYQVNLVVNTEYASKNNLWSLYLTADSISNTYIIPSDIWCARNPFHRYELYSWYSVSELRDIESAVRVNRKGNLVPTSVNEPGNAMIGICYLAEGDAGLVRQRLTQMAKEPAHDADFWEEAIFQKGKMNLTARVIPSADVVEINTYEQLRELDEDSDQLKSEVLNTIADTFHVDTKKITNIMVLKKGMTNRSFLFSVDGKQYIMRIPGEGTDHLISRSHEAAVYRAISGKGLCDDPVFIDPDSGYKITRYLTGIRTADPQNLDDVKKCIRKLRSFHHMKLNVDHVFDLFGQIEFYESLWEGKKSVYRDYETTKKHVFLLRGFIDSQKKELALTHIDAVPDNFLFYMEDGSEKLQLTDWEYSGMQDPHVDIAMWCVYSFYSKKQVDQFIDLYFEDKCNWEVRAKIYAYIAAAGLLWSNWCEYKAALGVEFGEYAMRQYRYAKEFFKYASELIERVS